MTDEGLRQAVAGIHEPWGGVLCLDFANTLEPRGGPPPFTPPPGHSIRDELTSYRGLVAWSVAMGVAEAPRGEALLEAAKAEPASAGAILDRGHALRDAIYRVFWAVAHGEPAPMADLAIIQAEHADALHHATLIESASESGFAWSWARREHHLASPLWPVAWSALDLLLTGEPARVRACPGVADQVVPCAWLFYDRTKNRSRRWCSMLDCGGATKARRQTQRRRSARDSEPLPR